MSKTATGEPPSFRKIPVVENNHPDLRPLLPQQKGDETADDARAAFQTLSEARTEIILTDPLTPRISGDRRCKIIRGKLEGRNDHSVFLQAFINDSYGNCLRMGTCASPAGEAGDRCSRCCLAHLPCHSRCDSSHPEKALCADGASRPQKAVRKPPSGHPDFELILESMEEGIIEINSEGMITYANRSAVSLTGTPLEKLRLTKIEDIFTAELQKDIREASRNCQKTGRAVRLETAPLRNDRRGSLHLLPITGGGRKMVAVIRVLSLQGRIEKSLAVETGLSEAVATMSCLLADVDSTENISRSLLEKAMELTASRLGHIGLFDPRKENLHTVVCSGIFSRDSSSGGKDRPIPVAGTFFSRVAHGGQAKLTNAHGPDRLPPGIFQGNDEIARLLSAPIPLQGEIRGLLTLANPSRDYTQQDLKIVEHLASLHGLLLQRQYDQERMIRLAHYDPLTGLANRYLLSDRLQQAVEQARRHRHKAAFLFIDVNDFKAVNDDYGHKAGDLVLREIGQRLHKSVRATDTVARIGGDEFVVILPEVENSKSAVTAAEKLIAVISPPIAIKGENLYPCVSIGISIFPEDGVSGDSLLNKADTAMYKAKRAKCCSNYAFFSGGADTDEIKNSSGRLRRPRSANNVL